MQRKDHYLPTLVVASENCDSVRVPHFQANQELHINIQVTQRFVQSRESNTAQLKNRSQALAMLSSGEAKVVHDNLGISQPWNQHSL